MKTLVKILFALLIAVAIINPAGAQSKKAIKEAKKAAEIKGLIDAKDYIFQASYMYPSGGGSRYLTSPYDLTVAPDTVEAYLPYFGVAYSGAGYNSSEDNGIKFKSTKFDYVTKAKKDGSYTINIKANDTRNATQMTLQVYANGNADLTVLSMNRQQIRFNGYIKERGKPKV
jgi:archaellum component FlaF (FlaF/FlaG flagellin family)